jgi:zinc transport system permease protein
VRRLNFLIALIAAVTIGVTMKIVGLLLVSGMLVLPVAAVQQLTSTFRTTLFGSVIAGAFISVAGLLIAFYADLAPGATIVLVSIICFGVARSIAVLRTRRGREAFGG